MSTQEQIHADERGNWLINSRFIHPLLYWLIKLPFKEAKLHESIYSELGLVSLKDYQGESPRIEGFKVDAKTQNFIETHGQYGSPTLPVKDITIIDERIYTRWRDNGRTFTKLDQQALASKFASTLKTNGKAVLRRAVYNKKDKSIPSLPTYNGKESVDDMLAALQDLYIRMNDHFDADEFVKEAFFYPYVDPLSIEDPTRAQEKDLPVGGVAYPLQRLEDTNGHIVIEIKAGYGDSAIHNSGHPQADTIRVHVNKPTKEFPAGVAYIDEHDREIYPFKDTMIVNRNQLPETWDAKPLTDQDSNGSGMWSVDIGDRTLSVPLFSNHAEAIALHLANSMWLTNTTRKLEFSTGRVASDAGIEMIAPVILENVPFELPEKQDGVIEMGYGYITQILDDANDIITLSAKIDDFAKRGNHINNVVVLTPRFVNQLRNNKTLESLLNNIGKELIIFSLLNSTEHVARNLDQVHTLVPTTLEMIRAITNPDEAIYDSEQLYKIEIRDGYGVLIPATSVDAISPIPDILTIKQARLMGFNTPEIIGGKGYGHSQLESLHYPIPQNSLVLTPTFIDKIIKANNLENYFRQIDKANSPRKLEQLFKAIYTSIIEIPEELIEELMERMSEVFPDLRHGRDDMIFVFRSNLSIEDNGKHPMAGTFDSKLNVHFSRKEVRQALLDVIKGYFKRGVAQKIFNDLSGNDRKRKLKTLLGSVLIEPRQPSDFSGTAFSYNRSGVSKAERESLTVAISGGMAGIVDGSPGITITRKRDRQEFKIQFPAGDTRKLSSTEFINLPDHDTSLGPPKYIILNLLRLCKYAAENLGEEQDMEYSIIFDKATGKWKIVYLQTRPILKIS